jgi:hypothetical protein
MITDRLSVAVNALKTGQPVPSPDDSQSDPVSDSNVDVSAEASVEESQSEPNAQAQEVDAHNPPAEDAESSKVDAVAKEKMFIRAPDGSKKEIEVDWNDKEKLKKYIHAAAGMRQFQVERDRARQELKQLSDKSKEVEGKWNTVKDIYEKEGVRGLINLLTQQANGYDLFLQQEMAKIQRRAEATPEELRQIELEERFEQEKQAREKLQQEMERRLQESQQKDVEASQKSLQAQLVPVFEKVRFKGQLGDAAAEQELDSAIWEKTLRRLADYDEDQITQATIDKEFRTVASNFRKVINKQVEAKTEKVIQQKKNNAAVSAAAVASRGYSSGTKNEEMMKNIRSGNITDALKNFLGGRSF